MNLRNTAAWTISEPMVQVGLSEMLQAFQSSWTCATATQILTPIS